MLHLLAVRTGHYGRPYALRPQFLDKLQRARYQREIHLPLEGIQPRHDLIGLRARAIEIGVEDVRERVALDGGRKVGILGKVFAANLCPKGGVGRLGVNQYTI